MARQFEELIEPSSSHDDIPLPMWAIVELMGKKRLAGKISEVGMFGAAFVRIDIPISEAEYVTRFFHPQAIYGITPTSEKFAERFVSMNDMGPLAPWEIKAMLNTTASPDDNAYEGQLDMTPEF